MTSRPRYVPSKSFIVICGLGVLALLLTMVSLRAAPRPALRTVAPLATPIAVSYNRDIRPLLADSCFSCHGPDAAKRKAGLALHNPESATTINEKSGVIAVIPGNPNASELVKRILSADDDERMPPTTSGKHLSDANIKLLQAWIAQGAPYQPHWAYIPPLATTPKISPNERWSRNPIDRFILERIQREGLQPSPDADPVATIRRLSFDLIGLPPSPIDVDAFVADHSDAAYEALVDRLFASPHFGERMAMGWLDLVRYADTIGYHSDNSRNVSPYRDWVIAAFNADMPFSQFTIEQIAGDLLPESTLMQKVASTYNRLTLTTEEGGAQAKEYEAKSAADRVRNLSSVWLGSTMGCCECHDHKYDPFTIRDFYSMAAFFADVHESAIGAREPGMVVPDKERVAELTRLAADMAALQQQLDASTPELEAAQAAWEQTLTAYTPPTLGPWWSIGPYSEASSQVAYRTSYDPERTIDLTQPYADGKAWVRHDEWKDGQIINLSGNNSAVYVHRIITAAVAESLTLSLGSDDTITVWINGAKVLDHDVYRGVAADQEKVAIDLRTGANSLLMKIVNGGGGFGFYFKAAIDTPADIAAIIGTPAGQRTATQRQQLSAHYRARAPLLAATRALLSDAQQRRTTLENGLRRTLATTAGPPRTVRIKRRGDWMDEEGDIVEPAVPHFLPPLTTTGRASRLDLARWLVSRDNPLTARVVVNRLWKHLFGQGLSSSLENFGTQGALPSHPELLDWLAIDFIDHGWSIKRALKQLVMSHAYRQASAGGMLAERDPDNRLLARQSRFRLDAELIRDNILSISGLLVPTVGGESVKPYQPDGYWMHLNFPAREWITSPGQDAYRRGLYTFWCRTFLHPNLLAFDASSRELCQAERPRSNTPLQALALLNDPSYVEAARVFAERIITHGGNTNDARITWAFRQALSRSPRPEEVAVLRSLYERRFAAAKAAATHSNPTELDAWTAVARTLLNLHETMTRY